MPVTSDMSETLRVDIWSDVACPWCYIGKRRFEEGVRRYADGADRPVEVEYHSFELAPDTPVDFEGPRSTSWPATREWRRHRSSGCSRR